MLCVKICVTDLGGAGGGRGVLPPRPLTEVFETEGEYAWRSKNTAVFLTGSVNISPVIQGQIRSISIVCFAGVHCMLWVKNAEVTLHTPGRV